MPVTTSDARTCPDSCPLKQGGGCYAKSGPMSIHWTAVNRGERGVPWPKFLEQLSRLPRGQLWRHNQAGDLPGNNEKVDARMLQELVEVNRTASLHGFTYTHKPMTPANAAAVQHANQHGFTINLSADTLQEADELAALGVAPVVVILPHDSPDSCTTPGGRKVITCPAQTRDRTNCVNCKLCADPNRTPIIGFLAHGSQSKLVEHKVKLLVEKEQYERT